MASLTKDIEELLQQLQSTQPQSITDLIVEIKNIDGALHKRYPSGWKMKSLVDTSLPSRIKEGGIYVFWWLNYSAESVAPFYSPMCSRQYILQGKKQKGLNEGECYQQIEIDISDTWLEQYKGHIPLYVGKSAESIFNRMSLHLQINHQKYLGKSTSDQLRRGIERLFKPHPNTADLIAKNVGYSLINLHGEDDVVNRFYLAQVSADLA